MWAGPSGTGSSSSMWTWTRRNAFRFSRYVTVILISNHSSDELTCTKRSCRVVRVYRCMLRAQSLQDQSLAFLKGRIHLFSAMQECPVSGVTCLLCSCVSPRPCQGSLTPPWHATQSDLQLGSKGIQLVF